MKKHRGIIFIIAIQLLIPICLIGCSQVKGTVETVEHTVDRSIVTFEDGRIFSFKTSQEAISIGKEVMIEYDGATRVIYDIITYGNDLDHNAIDGIKENDQIVICPRCQYTIEY